MSIEKFQHFEHSFQNIVHRVYMAGEGPAILLMHELPGMIPECIRFAERLIDQGFTVYMPLLFGKPGEKAPLKFFAQLCISKEFYLLAHNQTSPIVDWLRDLCKRMYAEKGGKGVGAIGMCLTGSFVIPLLLEPCVLAPVASQPSLPIGFGKKAKTAFACSDSDLQAAKKRTEEGIQIKAYRFSKDWISPKERIQTYRDFFGDALLDVELDSSQQQAFKKGCHSVFTGDFVDEPGHPTVEALNDLIRFYKEKLH